MTKPLLYPIIALILSIVLSGCASTSDLNYLQSEINRLQTAQTRTTQEQARQIEDLKKEMSLLVRQEKETLSKQTGAMRSTQANLWSEMEGQKVALAKAQGELEYLKRQTTGLLEHTTNNTETLKQVLIKLDKLEFNLTQIKQLLGLDLEDVKKIDHKNGANVLDNPRMLYQKALAAFKRKDYGVAEELWTEFIRRYPKHKLRANSYFWQGECFFQQGNYAQAILSYQRVIEKYPKSSKLPAALLKQGISFYRLKKKKAGQIILQKLIKKFPKRIETKRAISFLAHNK